MTFGILRYVLACMVLAAHFATTPLVGKYAVYVFFLLSGYLMTHILNRVYRGNVRGYLINRVLRIYPTYAVVLFATIALGAWVPDFVLFNSPERALVPESGVRWIRELLILRPKLVSQAWTIKVEIIYYVLMIYLSSSPARVRVWFGASVVIAIVVAFGLGLGLIDKPQFSNLIAASVPFSFGAWLWHTRQQRAPSGRRVGVIAGFFLASFSLPLLVGEAEHLFFGWISTLATVSLGGLLVVELSHVRASGWLKQVDDALGDLSYPVYLCHILAGSIVVAFLGLETLSPAMALSSIAATHLIALALRIWVEQPIEGLRHRFRSARVSPPQAA